MFKTLTPRVGTAFASLMSIFILLIGLSRWPVVLLLLLPLFFTNNLLRFLGRLHDRDEREILLSLKVGNLSFFLTYTLLVLAFIFRYPEFKQGIPPDWVLLLVIPPAFYFFAQLAILKSLKQSGIVIGLIFGGFWLLFTLLGHGLTFAGLIESLIGLFIIGTALASIRWPIIGSSLFLFEGIFAIFFFFHSGMPASTKLMMFVILPLPLLLSGIFILIETLSTHPPNK
ncbi:MAG: hypothetical protein GXO76_10935 [Calditrichaeota bacterium]|nr:hypothetical protein [Calditrichota bacterium]